MSKNNQEHLENFLGNFKGFFKLKIARKLLILTKIRKKNASNILFKP
jgi:hypothetical protein